MPGAALLIGYILPVLRVPRVLRAGARSFQDCRVTLTPLAASGLVIIMIGATTITAFAMAVAPAVVPMTIGVLAAFVAYGRWRLAPLPRRVTSPDGS